MHSQHQTRRERTLGPVVQLASPLPRPLGKCSASRLGHAHRRTRRDQWRRPTRRTRLRGSVNHPCATYAYRPNYISTSERKHRLERQALPICSVSSADDRWHCVEIPTCGLRCCCSRTIPIRSAYRCLSPRQFSRQARVGQTLDTAAATVEDMGVSHRRVHIARPQEFLHSTSIIPAPGAMPCRSPETQLLA